MEVPSFVDYFWGEKNNGFYVLYHNMKFGYDSSKDFSEFLRESCTIEENYAKLLQKLAKYISNSGSKGSFSLFWQLLKCLAEKLSCLHMQLVHSWQELIKDVQKYSDEQHKLHKTVKDSEASTLETVQSIQQTIVAVQKAKESYHARCFELEKLKRENAAQKDIEKAEAKHKKSHDEYRALVDKYSNVRNEFQTRMTESCKHFQQLEEAHLKKLREFVETYAKAWQNQMALLKQMHSEFSLNCNDLTVEKLIATFVHTKRTGSEKPGAIEFVEADLTKLPAAPANVEAERREIPLLEKPKKEGAGFLSKRKKDKKKKKKDNKDNISDDSGGSGKKVPVVDEEGFSVRPGRMRSPSSAYEDTNNWYSSSESDSDSEERCKIKVEIKPFSASGTTPPDNVDVIRKTVEGLRLSPTTVKRQTPTMELNNMKRSVSVSETMSVSRPSQDLLGLDLFGLSSGSASTNQLPSTGPTSVSPSNFASRIHLMNRPGTADLLTGSEPMYVDSGRQRSQTPTGTSLVPSLSHQRPAQRNNFSSTAWRDYQSPGVGEKIDGAAVACFAPASSSPYSRGPSPLTLGLADTIPLAVAFSETTNAYFRGTDPKQCRVKTTGDMMMSFPVGVVRVLIDNPSPVMLSFRVRNTQTFEHILLNKQLLLEDVSQGGATSKVFMFDMSALTDHLRWQGEMNKTASYFNVDILKYQLATPADVSQLTPLRVASFWKCDDEHTELRLDYSYNAAAKSPLSNVTVSVPVDGGATNMQAVPPATWCVDKERVVWRLGEVSSQGNQSGSLRAKFDVTAGPSRPATAAVQFKGEGSTLSGVDFELIGPGYRTSLVKKRFLTGKYMSEVGSEPPPA